MTDKNVCAGAGHLIHVHHLGHAAFAMRFGDDVTVLADYGAANAWVEWGWDSPIHEIGSLMPDVTTTSHTHHEDHYDETRAPAQVSHRLTGEDRLQLSGLRIEPFRTSEGSLDAADNTSFLFSYRGARVLHLGDAQATIMGVEDEKNVRRIRSLGWEGVDLLLMPIEGKTKFIEQAAAFLDLLRPQRVIPIHHWTEAYRQEFLDYLKEHSRRDRAYWIEPLDGPDYAFEPGLDGVDPVHVLVTQPAAYP